MARRDISMTPAEVHGFLDHPRNLVVTTIGPDGWPHSTPMWYVLAEGAIVFRSFTKSQKIVNLRRDPRLTVLAESGLAYEELRGVMIKGIAELNDDPEFVLGIYGRLAARYPVVGTEPIDLDSTTVRQTFGRYAAKNTAVIVRARKTISWDHTKLSSTY